MSDVTALRHLAALSLMLASACARTTDSTETGNPPVIDVARIALVEESGEVHVVGEPKAIQPGGGQVEVTTLASGEVARADVGGDGSFDVVVEGTLDDEYQLRAIGEEAPSEPAYFDRDGEIDPPDAGTGAGAGSGAGAAVDGGALSCEDRVALITERIEQVQAANAESCESNYDCVDQAAPILCPFFCRGVAVAYASLPETESALEAIGTSLCEPFEADGCYDGLPQPDCALPFPIGCVEGQCTRCVGDACPQTSCDACDTPLLSWSTRGSTASPGTPGGTYTLEDCRTLTFTPDSGVAPCSRTLPCAPSLGSDFAYTAAHVQNALGHPDVQAALAAGTSFGLITPGGFGFSLEVGDAGLFVSANGCAGAASCNEEPAAFALLRSVLQNIDLGAAPCETRTP